MAATPSRRDGGASASRWPGNLPRQQTAAAACAHPMPRDLPGDSRPETAAPSPRSCEANPGQAPRPGHGLMALSLSLCGAEIGSARWSGETQQHLIILLIVVERCCVLITNSFF